MKVIFFTTLLLFSINGFAFNWKKFSENRNGDLYLDIDNIKNRNRYVYYWIMGDLLEPMVSDFGPISSMISKYKVNCEAEKQTWLSVTLYSQSMGRGRIEGETTLNETKYPKPNSIGYLVMKFAQKNAK